VVENNEGCDGGGGGMLEGGVSGGGREMLSNVFTKHRVGPGLLRAARRSKSNDLMNPASNRKTGMGIKAGIISNLAFIVIYSHIHPKKMERFYHAHTAL